MIRAKLTFDERTKISYIKIYDGNKLIQEFHINNKRVAEIILDRLNTPVKVKTKPGWGS